MNESVLLVSRASPRDSKYHVSFPFSSILLHHRRPTKILNRNKTQLETHHHEDHLPASEVLHDPKVDGAQDDHDQETESLVVNKEAEDEIADEGGNFDSDVEHAVARVRRTLQKARH